MRQQSRGQLPSFLWTGFIVAGLILIGCGEGYVYQPLTTQGDELCDGLDDDGDGLVDLDAEGEPLLRDCSNQCGDGVEECVDGQWRYCSAPQINDEQCNGVDDDCDGDVDEGCDCVHGAMRDCPTEGPGTCFDGVEVCVSGQWSECSAESTPDPADRQEICDGRDNDCDGRIDEWLDCPCEAVVRSGHTYLFCSEAETWQVARDYCASLGYQLATIDGAVENYFIGQEAFSRVADYWWIGLHDIGSEGTFLWAGSGAAPGYTRWADNEPNNAGGDENCVATDYAFIGGWNDFDCEAVLPFVCKD